MSPPLTHKQTFVFIRSYSTCKDPHWHYVIITKCPHSPTTVIGPDKDRKTRTCTPCLCTELCKSLPIKYWKEHTGMRKLMERKEKERWRFIRIRRKHGRYKWFATLLQVVITKAASLHTPHLTHHHTYLKHHSESILTFLFALSKWTFLKHPTFFLEHNSSTGIIEDLK